MPTVTNATIAKRMLDAVKAQEKFAEEHREELNTKDRPIYVDRDGQIYRGITLIPPFGRPAGGAKTFLGRYDAISVLEKALEELGVKVTPYTYDKEKRAASGTLIETLRKLSAEKLLYLTEGRGVKLFDNSQRNRVNGSAVRTAAVPTSTKDLF